MKLFTDKEQSISLIELGFPHPQSCTSSTYNWKTDETIDEYNYSIGELLEILPRVITHHDWDYATISISHDTIHWIITYDNPDRTVYASTAVECIDALYNMCIKLKNNNFIK